MTSVAPALDLERLARRLAGSVARPPATAAEQHDLLAGCTALEPEWPGLVRWLRARVSQVGYAVVRDVPVDADEMLVALGSALGHVSSEGNGDPGRPICDVVPRSRPRGMSERRDRFPLHTDSVPLETPHAFVALACAEADGRGGRSLLLSAHALAEALRARAGTDVVRALHDPAFPVHVPDRAGLTLRRFPVLSRRDGRVYVRYRGDAMAAGAAAAPLDEDHERALAAVSEAIADLEPTQLTLAEGDLLLIDNRCMLHGRTAIAPGSRRRLRRMKISSLP